MGDARILNVDADEQQRSQLSRSLRDAGFEMIEAATGAEALAQLALAPELVILAVQLPDLDGYELAQRIRAHPAMRLVPILHLAATATAYSIVRGVESGADGHLTHPLEPDALLATVRALLRVRRAERELHRSLEQNSVILQNIADAVTAQDAAGRVVYANDAALRILGYARPADFHSGDAVALSAAYEILDENGLVVPPDQLPAQRVLDGAPAAELLVRWRRRGSRDDRWTLVRSRPVKDESGRAQLAINILSDVTERRRALERMMLLNEAGAILATLVDAPETLQRVVRLPVARLADWCILDLDGPDGVTRLVAHADPAGAALAAQLTRAPLPPLATTRAELLGTVDPEQLRADGDARAPALLELGARSLVTAPLAVRGHGFGALLLISTEAGRFTVEDLQLAQDLAQRAALAVDNARLYAQARLASDLRKELVAVVAHDLKNPLNAITMAATLLARSAAPGPDGDRARRQTAIVSRAADRMNRLIHDLLDVAAIDAGALSMQRERVAAGALLTEAQETMAPLALQKQVQLERQPAAADLFVAGDRERLLQVLSNLIGNAIKFTPAGGRVTLGAVRTDAGAQFSVADTGPGIAPEHLPHVFDRYWRVRKESRDGTGLGLSIVKGIIDAHGGTLSVATELGKGATFTFTIPLAC